jgi:amidase
LGTETGGSLVYPAGKAGLYTIRPTLGTVSANGAFRITRSFDGIGGMAKTPSALAVLTENILAPEARGNLQSGGFKGVMTGKWDGLRIGIAESAWGTGSTEKWNSPLVVRF